MRHPYQCLICCTPAENVSLLIAASGSYIHTFDLEHGSHLSTWPSCGNQQADARTGTVDSGLAEPASVDVDSDSPRKRQKLSPAGSESSSAEIVVDESSDVVTSISPPVVKLAVTHNSKHVVALTGEDKCIRVFEVSQDGILKHHSDRLMPKRPCAIAISSDDSIIFCADKFGDVYTLPLLGTSHEIAVEADDEAKGATKSQPFVPSASSATVHTKKNRDALRQQQKLTKKKSAKPPMSFDHELILGHVSLLTEVISVTVDDASGPPRQFIITADRDEHIRVSRGIPHSYIIEAYCLGHTQFVSKLCIIPSQPHLLVSGGGDDFLILWDWLHETMLQRIDLRKHIVSFRELSHQRDASLDTEDTTIEQDTMEHIAVSGIHAMQDDQGQTQIIVSIECLPALIIFSMDASGLLKHFKTHKAAGNVLDVVTMPDTSSLLLAIDTMHEPFSRSDVTKDQANTGSCISSLMLSPSSNGYARSRPHLENLVNTMEAQIAKQPYVGRKTAEKGRSIQDLLYGLESLRKRAEDVQDQVEQS